MRIWTNHLDVTHKNTQDLNENKSSWFFGLFPQIHSTFTRFVSGFLNFHSFHMAPHQLTPVLSYSILKGYFTERMTLFLFKVILIESLISKTLTCSYNFHPLLKVECNFHPFCPDVSRFSPVSKIFRSIFTCVSLNDPEFPPVFEIICKLYMTFS